MSAIKAGDLVMVVHACYTDALGWIFRVERLRHRSVIGCMYCGGKHIGIYAKAETPFGNLKGAPTWWLKKIDPLSEPEHVERKQEIPA